MPAKRITMQDIADACGLSRNTVSKVFNDRGAVPEATRQMILAKARELGYSQLPPGLSVPGIQSASQTIALLCGGKLMSHHFGNYFISAFADTVSRSGNMLKLFEVSPAELLEKRLPPHFLPDQIAGILCIELFNRPYLDMLCDLGLPVVTVDACADYDLQSHRCSYIAMRNFSSSLALVQRMIDRGAKRLGFVGDPQHCNTFQERWFGFGKALQMAGLPLDERCCVLRPDEEPYQDSAWLADRLREMPAVPDGFFCANDFLAIKLIDALKQLGLTVPKDVMVAGFDDSPESTVVVPPLSTAHIPSAEIGRVAADMLLSFVDDPSHSIATMLLETTPIFRESTG